ncbi:hypothetical protein KFL_000950090 [Klebsormidium nitens]|uniref:YHS domain-containing protein n=1 Tax=Klebsormidium nitens TaxID=105231 RepID=A0A1Y1HTI1_KLENI|nr:hypothetical protein KFL_000950090 [Klebsormidium nitens]|eukprot:GAQ81934.1 hypothetical protein KFL_000950090 [Klebsormidium nitens]
MAPKRPDFAENVIGDDNVALEGYSPVSIAHGKPTLGKEDITTTEGGIKYRFASEDELREFQQDPKRYIPAFGGWCAWHMYENEKMLPDYGHCKKAESGAELLFHADAEVNCLAIWNEAAGKLGEQQLMNRAEQNWQHYREAHGRGDNPEEA